MTWLSRRVCISGVSLLALAGFGVVVVDSAVAQEDIRRYSCLLYTSPSPRD